MSSSRSSSSQGDLLSELNLPSPLILGSGSFTRKLILEEMNIPFVLKVKPIDERNIGDRSEGSNPCTLVTTLATAKNEALILALLNHNKNEDRNDDTTITRSFLTNCENNSVTNNAANIPTSGGENNDDKYNLRLDENLRKECLVLTADQVVTHSTCILEKPLDIQQARDFVQRYAISPPSTVGAVVITHLPSRLSVTGVDISTIHFKPDIQHANLVDRLLDDGAPILSCAGGLMVEHPFVMEFVEKIDGTQDGVMGLSKGLVNRLLKELREKIDRSRG
jgi:septum formation protein